MRNRAHCSLMSRREFLALLSCNGAGALLASCLPKTLSTPSATSQRNCKIFSSTSTINTSRLVSFASLPRWRGFNLLEKFKADIPEWNKPFYENDLDIIAEWGLDFIRLPMDYRIWTISAKQYREKPLKEIDQVVEWAQLRGIHVNLCLHRAPGHCISSHKEHCSLWMDDDSGEEARQRLAEQWQMFSERYRNIPSWKLSFNLVNEPPNISGEIYARSVSPAINAIRQTDPERLIIADGVMYGKKPVYELVPYRIAQSTRGYVPFSITHYLAKWVKGADQYPIPTWPVQHSSDDLCTYNKETLWFKHVEPWKEFSSQHGIGIHVGEWGAYNKTPHDIVLGWMEDCLQNWKMAGMGWALWNLRGSFGVLNSERADVVYENYRGHKLDRKMLELIKQF